MKKNKMMRLASVMMVMTLMTTSVISGTFAKYTTQDSGSDVARVAKWGVELQVVGDLYGKNYETTNNTKTEASTDISVASNATPVDNVVAPGTINADGFSFTLKGTPEVSSKTTAKITTQNISLVAGKYGVMIPVESGVVNAENFNALITVTDVDDGLYVRKGTAAPYTYERVDAGATYSETTTYYTLEDYVEVSDTYYPVIYALETTAGGTTYSGDNTKDTIGEISKLIAEKINSDSTKITETSLTGTGTTYKVTSEIVGPNVDLATLFKLAGENITWAWAFGDAGKEGDDAAEDDKADTILGNLMAGIEVVKIDDAKGVAAFVQKVEVTNPATTGYSSYSYATVDGITIASLTTQFNIDITVTQVD